MFLCGKMPEDQHIEWKESWRDEYLRWICGFANANGGTLLIGRNDDGKDVGVANAAKLLADLPNKIRDVLGVVADVRLVKKAGVELIEIHVGAYESPISYKGEYHYRSGSTKQELRGEALNRFVLRKFGKTWDSSPVSHVSAKDLSGETLATFRRLSKENGRFESGDPRASKMDLLEKLNLIENGQIKRAAILLFHPNPEQYITGAFVKIGYFQTESELLYQDEIHGDLFRQAKKTLELLLTKYLRAGISYRGIAGLYRVEKFPVPEEALREAVLNALIHRDYAVGAPIQIRVYRDRLEIWNPGELPEGWQTKNFYKKHASRPYNPAIANAFFRSGEIEAWGRGIQRIVEACEAAKAPRPVISNEARDIWIEFHFPKEIVDAKTAAAARGNKVENEAINEVIKLKTENTKNTISTNGIQKTETAEQGMRSVGNTGGGEAINEVINEVIKSAAKKISTLRKLEEILQLNARITIPELAKALKLSKASVERHLQAMRDSGQLRRIGSRKNGQWELQP
jgi:ATP-dependent DNA helicase RecG